MLKTGKLVTTGPDCDRPFERGGRDFNSTKKTFCLICVRFGRFEKNVNVKYEHSSVDATEMRYKKELARFFCRER